MNARGALAAILLLGLALRLAGLDFGLDFARPQAAIFHNQADEESMALWTRDGHLAGHVADPGGFLHWGALGHHWFGLLDRVALPIAAKCGLAVGTKALHANLSPLILIHRLLSTIASLLAVVVVHRIGRRVLSPRAGLLAALVLATAYLAVREAHFGTLDSLLLLECALLLDRCLMLVAEPTARNHRIAGVLVALTAATKYSGVFLAVLVAAAHLASRRKAVRDGQPPPPLLRLIAAGAVCAAVYLALSPHVFLDPGKLLGLLRDQRDKIGFQLSLLPEVVEYHVRQGIAVGFGEVAAILAVAGAVRLGRRAREPAIALLLASLPLIALMPLSFHSMAVRHALPLFVPLALLAGSALDGALALPGSAPARAALVVLAVALSLVRVVSFDALVARTDTRQEALALLERSGAKREQVLGIGFYGLPVNSFSMQAPFVSAAQLLVKRPGEPLTAALEPRPELIVRDLSSGVDDWVMWDALEPVVASEYEPLVHLDGRRDGATPALPESVAGTKSHFIPFANPWSMRQPGPELLIYRRRVR